MGLLTRHSFCSQPRGSTSGDQNPYGIRTTQHPEQRPAYCKLCSCPGTKSPAIAGFYSNHTCILQEQIAGNDVALTTLTVNKSSYSLSTRALESRSQKTRLLKNIALKAEQCSQTAYGQALNELVWDALKRPNAITMNAVCTGLGSLSDRGVTQQLLVIEIRLGIIGQ